MGKSKYPVWGDPFTASINGVTDVALTNTLNSLSQTGPVVQFFTTGIPTSLFSSSNILTLSINEGGDGGDGWAVDYLTIGITPAAVVPEPSSLFLIALGLSGLGFLRRRST